MGISSAATDQKINLIKALKSRAKRISSPTTLDAEIKTLQGLFVDSGYPSHLVIVKDILPDTAKSDIAY